MAELYLYNGVKLPKIPDTGKFWDDRDCKYVLIRRYFDARNNCCYTAYYSSGEFPYYEEDETIFISGYDFCSNLSGDLEWGTPRFFSGAGSRFSASSFFWTNHEIKSAGGDTIVPAPDPVPLYGSKDWIYAKIYNSENNNVAYCRIFRSSEVTIGSSYNVTFNDGIEVDIERDFISLPQVSGGAEPSTDRKILWAFEPLELKERDYWGQIFINALSDGSYWLKSGSNSAYYFGGKSAEDCVDYFYNNTKRYALVVGGQKDLSTSYVYPIFYDTETGKYTTTNQSTNRYSQVSDLTKYYGNPGYAEPVVGSVYYNAMIQGWLIGKRLAAMRGHAQQVVDTARLGLATLGRMILGKE